jgi:hypothetical protein
MQAGRLVPAFALGLALALDPAADVRAAQPAAQSAGRGDAVVEFRLSDQFGRPHATADHRGRAYLLVGAGKGGRAAGTAWVERLRAMQGDSAGAVPVPVIAVADLRGVPRLLRRLVRGRFPDDPRQPVLLDWDGVVARSLGFDAQTCTIVVVDPAGRPRARETLADVDTARARAILREAETLTATALADEPR